MAGAFLPPLRTARAQPHVRALSLPPPQGRLSLLCRLRLRGPHGLAVGSGFGSGQEPTTRPVAPSSCSSLRTNWPQVSQWYESTRICLRLPSGPTIALITRVRRRFRSALHAGHISVVIDWASVVLRQRVAVGGPGLNAGPTSPIASVHPCSGGWLVPAMLQGRWPPRQESGPAVLRRRLARPPFPISSKRTSKGSRSANDERNHRPRDPKPFREFLPLDPRSGVASGPR